MPMGSADQVAPSSIPQPQPFEVSLLSDLSCLLVGKDGVLSMVNISYSGLYAVIVRAVENFNQVESEGMKPYKSPQVLIITYGRSTQSPGSKLCLSHRRFAAKAYSTYTGQASIFTTKQINLHEETLKGLLDIHI